MADHGVILSRFLRANISWLQSVDQGAQHAWMLKQVEGS
jgi:hypothetical protein